MPEFFTSVTAGIFIIFQTGVTDSDGCFHAPAFADNPLVSVRDAGSVQTAVIAVVPHSEYIQVADIHFSVVSVQAEETSVETFAEPVAQFRLYEPVLDLAVVAKLPRIVVAGYIEGDFLCQSDFESQVGSARSPVEGIGLDGEFG